VGVLSNAKHWKFIRIENEGQLFVSGEFWLELSPDSMERNEVEKIYRMVFYVVKKAFEASPTTSPIEGNFASICQSSD
jgi:hypothetical protein